MSFSKSLVKLTPFQFLLIGFGAIIAVGTALLTLPVASAQGTSQSFIDALFTATSAVTTTGLVVVDTGSFYSVFGQMVILCLIQVGGLGYMIFIVLAVLGLSGRVSLGSRMLLQESLVRPTSFDMIKFAKRVVIFTLLFESVGMVLLALYWWRDFPITQAAYLALFHSISTFCTAGFSVFADSFTAYRNSIVLNSIIAAGCISGGIGFFVLYDIYALGKKAFKHEQPRSLSVHSKFVLLLSTVLMIIGAGVIFLADGRLETATVGETLLSSVFQSISASTTTGFNTIDVGAMSTPSLLATLALMFIGASPGGTGGGIKTASFGILLLFVASQLSEKEDINLFKRRIVPETVHKAFTICSIAVLWIMFATTVLAITEKTSFLRILFETVSALGTVGLSTGMTPHLSTVGKVLITLTMFIGRVGPLTIGFSLRGKPQPAAFQYPEAEVFVG